MRKPVRKPRLDVSENMQGLLCYLGGWVTGILFLLLGRCSRFVKFHAMQSVLTFLPLFTVISVVRLVPIIGGLLESAVTFFAAALWLMLMYKAYRYEFYRLPVIGYLAQQILK